MQVIDYLASNGPWAWIVAGLVMLGLELVLPGGFLLWMGVAGVVTGLVTLVWAIGWPLQWLIFGVLSLVAIALWVRWTRSRGAQSDRPFLNTGADRLVGQLGVLDQPIASGHGRLALGDTVWRVTGPDMPAGRRVRIVGSDGAVLRVEAAE